MLNCPQAKPLVGLTHSERAQMLILERIRLHDLDYTYDVLATDIPGGQLDDEPVTVTDWRNVVLHKYGGDKKTVRAGEWQ